MRILQAARSAALWVMALFAILGLASCEQAPPSALAPPGAAKAAETKASLPYAKLPVSFEENRGQTDGRVRFLSRQPGFSLFLTPTEAVLSLSRSPSGREPSGRPTSSKPGAAVVRMKLVGANPNPELRGADRLPGETNYLTGRDPKRRRTGIASYGKVRYRAAYPGIDLLYHGRRGQLEYDFEVAPKADPAAITLSFAGVERLALDDRGNLVLHTSSGRLRQARPVAYQRVDGLRRPVRAEYVLEGRRRVSLRLARYDDTRELVIDPTLDYSTYLGGSARDGVESIAVDSSGSAYLGGGTGSTDFPTKNAAQEDQPGGDVFVAKLNPAGSALEYSTYLGGSSNDDVEGIAVDPSGRAYVTGNTTSEDFPTKNAFQSQLRGGGSLFVTRLSASGSALDYSTYLGGDRGSEGNAVASDSSGGAYVTGRTFSTDFPTKNAFDSSFGGVSDTFVAKLDTNASGAASLAYSTYLGGALNDIGFGIAVDPSGSAHVTGTTASPDYPTKNAFQPIPGGGNEVFVTKLNPAGSALDYSTFLGGTDSDDAFGIAIDPSGSVYVVGRTDSSNYPTKNAVQATKNGTSDVFVTKLKPAGFIVGTLEYSTYLGGTNVDAARAVASDSCGGAYLTGLTSSSDFPTKDPVQGPGGGLLDGFVTRIAPDGSALGYSTYLGGKEFDGGFGIAVDASGRAIVAGGTASTDFPVRNPLQGTLNGPNDAFVTALSAPFTPCSPSDPPPAASISDAAVTEGDAGTTPANFTVSLSGASAQPVSVDFATADDTATAPEDYNQKSGTLTFAPGEVNKTLTVDVNGDMIEEPDERFFVNLSNPQGATISDSKGIGTIIDDDGPGAAGPGPTAGPGPGAAGPGPTAGPGPGAGAGGARRCVSTRGGIKRTGVGVARLGRTRTGQRRILKGTLFSDRPGIDRYCVREGGGSLRVGYPTKRLNAKLSKKTRKRIKSKAVLLVSTSKAFRLSKAKIGTGTKTLARRLKGERRLKIGRNTWYVAQGKRARILFRTRKGKVLEMGLADKRLTTTRGATVRLLRAWDKRGKTRK